MCHFYLMFLGSFSWVCIPFSRLAPWTLGLHYECTLLSPIFPCCTRGFCWVCRLQKRDDPGALGYFRMLWQHPVRYVKVSDDLRSGTGFRMIEWHRLIEGHILCIPIVSSQIRGLQSFNSVELFYFEKRRKECLQCYNSNFNCMYARSMWLIMYILCFC